MVGNHLFSVPSQLDLSHDELRARGNTALTEGDHQTASRYFDWAYLRARQIGDRELIDTAICNRAALAVEFGHGVSLLPELTRVFDNSVTPPGLRCLAAYNLSRILAFENRRSEAMSYAREAYGIAKGSGEAVSIAMSTYRLGLEYLKESRYELARRHLEEAADAYSLLPSSEEELALVASSLGYCLSMQGDRRQILPMLDHSATLADAAFSETYTMDLRLNYGFTFLNLEEHETAAAFADEVLSQPCHPDETKHALYMAGSAYVGLGRIDDAEYFFHALQSEFYPDQPMVVDLLLEHDTFQLFNWLA